jgi:hyperosmotically inducible protein
MVVSAGNSANQNLNSLNIDLSRWMARRATAVYNGHFNAATIADPASTSLLSLPLMVEPFPEQLSTEQPSSRPAAWAAFSGTWNAMSRCTTNANLSYSRFGDFRLWSWPARPKLKKCHGAVQPPRSTLNKGNIMKPVQHKILTVVSSLAMLLALGACDRAGDRTAGQQLDSAASKTESAAKELQRDAKDATASAGAAIESAVDKTKAMGASAGDKIDDALITTEVKTAIAADKDLSAIKIDVDTRNGVVTLSGPAPTVAAKERASEIARNVKGVSTVNNQLTIKAG